MGYSLKLFGIPRAVRAGVLYDVPLDKPASMLFYLAQRADWVSRSELAFLYHPDVPEEVALGNVRVFIYRAKKHAWTAALEVEKVRLRFRVDTDTHAFLEAFGQKQWDKALALYQGSFLAGLQVTDTPAYEAWLELERQNLAQKWREAVLIYSQQLEHSRDFKSAAGWLEQLLNADPLDEMALQGYLSVLYGAGKRKQANDAFERFCQLLKTELDAEPLEATRTLLESLRHGQQSVTQRHAAHNLPALSSRFVGRERELTQLGNLLQTPDCRLITLVGLGGVGKTRLGLELAHRQLKRYPNGVWFVPLAGVQAPELLISSIAAALIFEFAVAGDPKEQLLNFLRAKELLIVLDNFEQLVAGAGLLEELLSAAPKLRLLVTSRTALELSGEWLMDVDGLSYPPPVVSEPPDSFDAVKLFIHCAERLSTTFVPTGQTLLAIAELTRKVKGLPLALELAAAWTRSLSVPALLKELTTNLDILVSQWRDLPERHRSLRTVFDYSWRRLSPKEQEALAKLSIFRGGFTLAAAEQVAALNLALLLSLINRSLIKRNETGRFQIHELLRQFALSHLSPEQTAQLEAGFSRYYLDFVSTHAAKLRGKTRRTTKDLLFAEADNLRLAWEWAICQQQWEYLDKALHGVYQLWVRANLFQEGKELIIRLLNNLVDQPLTERLMARACLRLGYFLVSLGVFAEAKGNFERAITALRKLNLASELAFALHELGHVIRRMGDLPGAEIHLQEGLEIARALDDNMLCADVLFHLSLLRRDQGRFAEAKACLEDCIELSTRQADNAQIATFQAQLGVLILQSAGNADEAKYYLAQGCDLFEALGNTDDQSICLYNLGRLAYEQGNLAESKQLLRESLQLRQYLGSPYMQESVLSTLGEIARDEGNYQEAQEHFLQSLAISRQLQSPVGQMYALVDLGDIAKRQNDDSAATEYFKQALWLASMGVTPGGVLIEVLYFIAAYLQTRLPEEAYLAAAYLSQQTDISQHLKDKIQQLTNHLIAHLSPQVIENLQAEVASLSLETVLIRQQALLETA